VNDIHALLVRYCELMDAADFDGVGNLFRNGVLKDDEGNAFAEGADGVADFYRRALKLYDESPRTKHLVLNVVIEPDGEAMVARSSYLVLQAIDDASLEPIVTGRYLDRFELVDGAWAFVERRFFVDLAGDLSHHLRFEI
jgi:3-phenylpropionate/cinnamic acid dioxygenase small subunit